MRYNIGQYAQALYEALDKAEIHEKYMQNFLNILLKNNDLSLVDKIINKVEKIHKEKKGIVKIKISSSKKLDNQQLKNLRSLISSKVEIKQNINPELIGGLKIQIGDLLIDGSIKGQLSLLKKKLNTIS